MIIEIFLILAIAYLSWSLILMDINYRRASSMDIPLVRLPVDPLNLAWLIFEGPIWALLDRLPVDWGTFGIYSRRGWHFGDKAKAHLKYGPAWALVTPRDVYVYVADPDAIHDVFTRREDFIRPSKMYKLLEVYGPCISTASWSDWPRHRKVLAAPFNESIMTFVWNETLKQAGEMLHAWIHADRSHAVSTAKDSRTLSLNVLAATGFCKSYSFRSSAQSGTDEARSYRDALQTVLDNAIFLMIVPFRFLKHSFLPKSWSRIGEAAADFKEHMVHMLNEETSLRNQGKAGTGSLMTSFVRALDTREKAETVSKSDISSSQKGLTMDEIFGNIFVINFAGHDTTANTLAFAMLLLAANPEVQEWVAEELNAVTDRYSEDWEYSTTFPHLTRSRAVLLETLRLFPPIMSLPKWSNSDPQTLRFEDRSITIPPHTGVLPALLAIQTHPKYWADPLIWRPERWITTTHATTSPSPETVTSSSSPLSHETLITPQPGTYFPFSAGPQSCPGAKFAQVEFVAVLARLLRQHRVDIVRKEDETFEEARTRVLAVTEDCDLQLLLRMRDADAVRLVWRRA